MEPRILAEIQAKQCEGQWPVRWEMGQLVNRAFAVWEIHLPPRSCWMASDLGLRSVLLDRFLKL
ncbi:MAG: hypothetical protein ACO331_03185 [Prochlorothrix sp.]